MRNLETPIINSVTYTTDTTGNPTWFIDNNDFIERKITDRNDPFNCNQYTWSESEIITSEKLQENETDKLKEEIKRLQKKLKGEKMASPRRLVKVIIVDPDENIPVDRAILVNEPEQITDLDDKELFFEMDLKQRLAEHNKLREQTIDKKASKNKDKDVYLEPARIRDLNMQVVVLASF